MLFEVIMMSETIWLDVSIIRCPYCGKLYVDSSWYVVEMESDLECSICGESFNSVLNLVDRVLVKFNIRESKVHSVKLDKHLESDI